MPPRSTAVIVLALSVPLLGTACSASQAASPGAPGGAVTAIGAENEYASVISQLGGTYVRVTAVLSNPNPAPHTFESSASVTQEVSGAQLVVQNGVGYDSFRRKREAAAPSSARTVIDVQNLLRLPDSTPNPHLWYSPSTMPAVAKAIAGALSRLQPAHAAFFAASLRRFVASLQPWHRAIAQFKAAYPGTPVATTKTVADYMLQATGTRNLTAFPFQADMMNCVDPSPQDVSLQDSLFSGHKVKVFLYNQQVTDTLTESFLTQARKYGIPVVGVYETLPAPGYEYQTCMLAEITALHKAVADKISTQKL